MAHDDGGREKGREKDLGEKWIDVRKLASPRTNNERRYLGIHS